jgi:hypothetical protein
VSPTLFYVTIDEIGNALLHDYQTRELFAARLFFLLQCEERSAREETLAF